MQTITAISTGAICKVVYQGLEALISNKTFRPRCKFLLLSLLPKPLRAQSRIPPIAREVMGRRPCKSPPTCPPSLAPKPHSEHLATVSFSSGLRTMGPTPYAFPFPLWLVICDKATLTSVSVRTFSAQVADTFPASSTTTRGRKRMSCTQHFLISSVMGRVLETA